MVLVLGNATGTLIVSHTPRQYVTSFERRIPLTGYTPIKYFELLRGDLFNKMIVEFLQRLNKIEHELEAIGRSNVDMLNSYTGTSFPEQKQLAENILDNLILAATHETATTIGFYRASIKTCCSFIEFRCTFGELTDDELYHIIDNVDCDIHFRVALKKKLSCDNVPEYLNNIRNAWNKQFNNVSYYAIKSRIYNNVNSVNDAPINK